MGVILIDAGRLAALLNPNDEFAIGRGKCSDG